MEGSRIADIVFGTEFHVVFSLVLRVRCLYLALSLRRWDRGLPGSLEHYLFTSLDLAAFSFSDIATLNTSCMHSECCVHSLYSSWGESPTSPGSSCQGDSTADRILPTAVKRPCQLTKILKPFQIQISHIYVHVGESK